MLKRVFEGISVLLGREILDESPPPSKEPRPSFLSWLLQPEKLPAPAVSVPPRRTPLWRLLFLPEDLPAPDESVAGPKEKSLLAELLSREELPRDPAPLRGKPGRSEKRRRRKKDSR